jgi:hypothetical protein
MAHGFVAVLGACCGRQHHSCFLTLVQDARGQAAVDAARTALGAPGWGDAVLSQLAHTHPATGGGGDSLQKR